MIKRLLIGLTVLAVLSLSLMSCVAQTASDANGTGDSYFNNVYPSSNNTYSLGNSTYQWQSIYVNSTYINGILQQTAYGQLYSDDSSDQVTVITAGTYYHYSPDNAGLSNNTTVSQANGTITIMVKGVYRITESVSASVTHSNSTLHWKVFDNGNGLSQVCSESRQSTNAVAPVDSNGLVQCAVGDVLELKATSDSSGDVLSITHADLTVSIVSCN